MDAVIEFAGRGGKVVGICNGFQILCEAGLLPGALLRNTNMKYVCKNIYLQTQTKDALLTQSIAPGTVLKVPIAHGDGRYYADKATLKTLNDKKQIIFKYCDASGHVTDEANPNGSLENIAGICNEGRNVFGMMPHPERASEEDLGNTDGRLIFESLAISVFQSAL
jgi:phosphoribosylformylglycinamidine synthase